MRLAIAAAIVGVLIGFGAGYIVRDQTQTKTTVVQGSHGRCLQYDILDQTNCLRRAP